MRAPTYRILRMEWPSLRNRYVKHEKSTKTMVLSRKILKNLQIETNCLITLRALLAHVI